MSTLDEIAAGSSTLSAAELRRYARHLVIPEVGVEGQERLRAARVLLVGAGGLGSPASLYLAAAGVGTLGLVEFDRVDESNLQRQVLYGDADLGRPKIEAAVERLRGVNPNVRFEPHPVRLDAGNALELVEGYDLVVDGSDNFPTRYLVNDACVKAGRPDVWGAVFRFEGQVSIFGAPGGPCYRCLFPEPPPPGLVPSCAEGGVLGVLPGIVGALQANEAVKWILGAGDSLVGRLVLFDALAFRFRELQLPRSPECPVCSREPAEISLRETAAVCADPSGGPAPRPGPPPDPSGVVQLAPRQVAERLGSNAPPLLLDVRNPNEHAYCRIEGSTLVPLHELPVRFEELDREREIVVYCHTGVRSAEACRFLAARGFPLTLNLAGGIEAWSLEVDPSVPRY